MASGISTTLQDRYPLKSNGTAKNELNGSYFLEEKEGGRGESRWEVERERERTCRWMLRKVDLEGDEGGGYNQNPLQK